MSRDSPQRVVLVVDDDELLRQVLEVLLAEAGYRVLTACDGEEGLARTYSSSPDVVLLDMMMPGVDGIAFLERLPGQSRAPLPAVIAYSGFQKFRELALSKGAAAFIQKPFDASHLLEAIAAQFLVPPPEPQAHVDMVAIERAERMRERILHAVPFDDVALRKDLRRVAAWAADYFGTEKSFVGVLHCERLFVLAQSGTVDVAEDVPLDPAISYCSEVIRAASPLSIRDTKEHPAFSDHPAAIAGLRFYAGAPLYTDVQASVGTFCVRDSHPFEFYAEDLAILSHFARVIGRGVADLADHKPYRGLFDAAGVLAPEALSVLVEAELRRAERDRSAVIAAVVRGSWDDQVTKAVVSAAGSHHLTIATGDGGRVVLLLGAADPTSAEDRLQAMLNTLGAHPAARAVGIVYLEAREHRLLSAESFMGSAHAACEKAELALDGVYRESL